MWPSGTKDSISGWQLSSYNGNSLSMHPGGPHWCLCKLLLSPMLQVWPESLSLSWDQSYTFSEEFHEGYYLCQVSICSYTSASLQGFSVRRLFPGDRAEETEHLHHLKTWTVCPGKKCEYPTHMKYIIMKQSKGIWVMACTPILKLRGAATPFPNLW